MSSPYRLVVFNALMLRALVSNDDEQFPDELAAFRAAFQGRRFRILLTDGILAQYEFEALKAPRIRSQPMLSNLSRMGRAIYVDVGRLNPVPVQPRGLPQEHREFILDAMATRASYVITHCREWLRLSPQTSDYNLQIVTPRRFVELAG